MLNYIGFRCGLFEGNIWTFMWVQIYVAEKHILENL